MKVRETKSCETPGESAPGLNEAKAKGKEATNIIPGQSSGLRKSEEKVKMCTSGKSSGQEPKKRRTMHIKKSEIEKECENGTAIEEVRSE